MRASLLCAALLLCSLPAAAHFKLTQPKEWIDTGVLGDPQKEAPCGSTGGSPTGAVRPLVGGQKITVKWKETIFHPGHFRISIVEDRAQLVTPSPVVEQNDCKSAPIEADATWPFRLDGLFPHDAPRSDGLYEQELTVPDVTCDDCTLQVLQFMSSHPPSCFYFHCANVKIVQADAGVPYVLDDDLGGGAPKGCGCSGGAGMLSLFAAVVSARGLFRRRFSRH